MHKWYEITLVLGSETYERSQEFSRLALSGMTRRGACKYFCGGGPNFILLARLLNLG